jgi:hypothetical protein
VSEPCPRCGYVRQAHDVCDPGECGSCGIIFEKFLARRAREQAQDEIAQVSPIVIEPYRPLAARIGQALTYVPERVDEAMFWGRCAALALIVVWGQWFMRQPWSRGGAMNSFLHNVNLPFHEFGHVLFAPLGTWMQFLGGSLFQCLLPLLIGGYFLFRREPFSAAVCLWWCGENFLDVAPYIGDARSLSMQLIGEATEEIANAREYRHDWHNILAPLGALNADHRLAGIAQAIGTLLMLAAWCWGGALLWKQRARLG